MLASRLPAPVIAARWPDELRISTLVTINAVNDRLALLGLGAVALVISVARSAAVISFTTLSGIPMHGSDFAKRFRRIPDRS